MKDYNQVSIYEMHQDMKTFFYAKEFNLVKYLLTSPELKCHADINFSHDFLFEHACIYGYTDFIKFILETPSLGRIKPLKESCISGMHYAVEKGHLDTLQYFENKLDENNDSITPQYLLLLTQQACAYGKLNVFSYLTEKYLKNNSFTDKDYKVFSKVFETQNLDLINYLIFELNMPKTTDVDKMLEHNPIKNQIDRLFFLRELNQNLNQDLNNTQYNQSANKKAKM